MYPLKPIFYSSLLPFFQLQYKTLFLFLQTFATYFKSYSVYSNGYIHQWGTYDKGSDNRSVYTTVTFSVQYSNENSYTINIAGIRAGNGNFTGGIGVRDRHSYSAYIGWYGLSENDLSRYLKWEVMGY